jgi:hypothetical protein
VALSQIGNVGPDLGQSYIIDSFLVVVLGGVGQLAGSVMAAFGLGIANKILERRSAPCSARSDPRADHSVYPETPAGTLRTERTGDGSMNQPLMLTATQKAGPR